ncbi:hypothetical protein D9M68_576880 [compost metagenome]
MIWQPVEREDIGGLHFEPLDVGQQLTEFGEHSIQRGFLETFVAQLCKSDWHLLQQIKQFAKLLDAQLVCLEGLSRWRLRYCLNQELCFGRISNEFFCLLDEIQEGIELQIIPIVVLPDPSAGALDICQRCCGAYDARIQGLGQGYLLFQKLIHSFEPGLQRLAAGRIESVDQVPIFVALRNCNC